MKHTKEEIVNALKVIKEECADHVCPDCPFFVPKQSDTASSCRIKMTRRKRGTSPKINLKHGGLSND